MSALYHNAPRSRGSNRNTYQNYMGSSVNRRNDVNLLSQNYNNYYGAPSLSKDYKSSSNNNNVYLSHLSTATKDSGMLPKINYNNNDRREEERSKQLYSR